MRLELLAAAVIALGGQGMQSPAGDVPGASIRGSPESMQEQHRVALEHRLPFYLTEDEIRQAVARGELVDLPGDANYEVADFVDLPYLIPEGRIFVERTAALYRAACGERLVVTSAVRAIEDQPPNAHELSVHPAGMAVDLRVSPVPECTDWLEEKLLALEQRGFINGIREFHPPHYHVAVYPNRYAAYVVAQRQEGEVLEEPVDPRRPRIGWAGVLLLLALAGAAFFFMTRRMEESGP